MSTHVLLNKTRSVLEVSPRAIVLQPAGHDGDYLTVSRATTCRAVVRVCVSRGLLEVLTIEEFARRRGVVASPAPVPVKRDEVEVPDTQLEALEPAPAPVKLEPAPAPVEIPEDVVEPVLEEAPAPTPVEALPTEEPDTAATLSTYTLAEFEELSSSEQKDELRRLGYTERSQLKNKGIREITYEAHLASSAG